MRSGLGGPWAFRLPRVRSLRRMPVSPAASRWFKNSQAGTIDAKGMREIVFRVTAEQPGRIRAIVQDRGLVVEAPSLEELHHEAREALIRQVGPAHGTYRIRIRRDGLVQPPRLGTTQPSGIPFAKGSHRPLRRVASSGLMGAGAQSAEAVHGPQQGLRAGAWDNALSSLTGRWPS